MVRGLNHAFIARSLAAVRDVFIMAFIESSKAPIGALYIDASHGRDVDVARAGAGYRYCTGTYLLFRSGKVQYCTGKKTPGGAGTHTGHTRDTRAHTGTRITQMNLTTIQTQRHTRTAARPRDGRNRGRLNKRRSGADRSPRPTHWYTKCVLPVQLVWHVFGRTTSTGKKTPGGAGTGDTQKYKT